MPYDTVPTTENIMYVKYKGVWAKIKPAIRLGVDHKTFLTFQFILHILLYLHKYTTRTHFIFVFFFFSFLLHLLLLIRFFYFGFYTFMQKSIIQIHIVRSFRLKSVIFRTAERKNKIVRQIPMKQ